MRRSGSASRALQHLAPAGCASETIDGARAGVAQDVADVGLGRVGRHHHVDQARRSGRPGRPAPSRSGSRRGSRPARVAALGRATAGRGPGTPRVATWRQESVPLAVRPWNHEQGARAVGLGALLEQLGPTVKSEPSISARMRSAHSFRSAASIRRSNDGRRRHSRTSQAARRSSSSGEAGSSRPVARAARSAEGREVERRQQPGGRGLPAARAGPRDRWRRRSPGRPPRHGTAAPRGVARPRPRAGSRGSRVRRVLRGRVGGSWLPPW